MSLYTPELAETICRRLVEGESLRAICRDETMPGASTVFDWLEANEEFRSKYARARSIQAELGFDLLQEIADDGTNDFMMRGGDNPGWIANGEHIQRSKLRAETLRWRLSKLLPKKYGDKVETTHVGDKERPIVMQAVDADL